MAEKAGDPTQSSPIQFGKPTVVNSTGTNWALFAEPESRVRNCEIQGTSYIGFGSYINSGTIRSYSQIGRYCSIGRGVSIGLGHHSSAAISTSPFIARNLKGDMPPEDPKLAQREPIRRVIIGHDCWIGDGVMIMSGIKIGNGSIIGAGALVTRDVEPYEIVGGIPAKKIRNRFDPETVARLIKSEWWNLDPKWLGSNLHWDIHTSLSRIESEAAEAPPFPFEYHKLSAK